MFFCLYKHLTKLYPQLSSDQMYLTAIRNLATIPSGANGPSDIGDPGGSTSVMDGGPGQLAKTFSCEKAKNMLYCVRIKEMAIAAAKWIAQQLPLGTVGIVSKQTGAASVGNWSTRNWVNQTSWLSKLYHRKVKGRCWRFER